MRKVIKEEVERLIKKHKTNDPFEIAASEHILIFEEPLGLINGYYNKFVRQKMIHINSNLKDHKFKKFFTCAHELGHATIHPNANTPFLRNNTFFSIDRLEIEANTFAVFMTIPEDLLFAYEGFTCEQISKAEDIPVQALKLRFMDLLR
ncbi:ImmA/IrrE family metallo-endopeptidase [Clostridium pasteurianum]|uniref:Putative Zn peptidase n=1 Tax=Clostridium pasteurianum BC1 TaxID=86416 RepID=R4KCM3_CLOPA|nr:ImmA/IrrE family metallo-endopeptidase [Clostridium pasteurianum]AGK97365.1 putative Zn peptidase [Clostridium pasteurianum BC1]